MYQSGTMGNLNIESNSNTIVSVAGSNNSQLPHFKILLKYFKIEYSEGMLS